MDTGIGLNAEALDKIRKFQPFTQADTATTRFYGGTGLGLAITQSLVKMMGDDMKVISSPEFGSEFRFQLVLQKTQKRLVSEHSEIPDSPRDNDSLNEPLSLLLVEDNYLIQELFQKMLEALRHRCEVAKNGLEGFKSCQVKKYDIIFMDIMMPVMGGMEATKLIRRSGLNVNTHIIALTANQPTPEFLKEMYQTGFNACVTKPVTLRKLRDTIRQFWEAHS